MLALPEARSGVGVKVAVRVKPLPLRGPSDPPLSCTSPLVPFQLKLLPGSSLKVKVMSAVSPALSTPLSLLSVSAGARVSMAMMRCGLAALSLPAASVRV